MSKPTTESGSGPADRPKVMIVSNTDWYLYNFRSSLARFLLERGFDVVLISPSGEFTGQFRKLGLRWIPWYVNRKGMSPGREIASILRIIRIYRREKPELVHHHTIKPALYGSMAARLLGVPAVVNSITGRGYVFLENGPRAWFARRAVRWLSAAAFGSNRCHAVFENRSDQEFFTESRMIRPVRSRLIESVGVDTGRFVPRPEPGGVPVVLQASRMLWDKGVGVLVEAARLLRRHRQVRVAFAGWSDSGNPASIPETTLQSWEAEGVIEWWKRCADMNAAYGRCHIVVLPSMGEGSATALLEAGACGRPVVTTDVPGCRDFVRDGQNGFVVPPNDPVALSGALAKLVADSDLRRRMGSVGRQRVLEKYTTGKVNAATLAVYRELLDRREG